MSTYQKAPKAIVDMANEILCQFESHKPLLDLRVKIDFIVARAELDKHGEKRGHAIVWRGVRAYGLCRILGLKDRVMGRGDPEILLDGDFWDQSFEERNRALLDHELHHLEIRRDGNKNVMRDDLGRPKLVMRRHDFEVGWFHTIAERHGAASIECLQAKNLMDSAGQFYWPEFFQGKK